MALHTFESLPFDNSFARLPDTLYARVSPTPFTNPPQVLHWNRAAAALLDLDPQEGARPDCAGLFGGSLLLPGMEPLAMLYAGHQFGVYVPQLGDGRAILLGEVRTAAGTGWELQLKGAGLTPFSRDGDGRAVLRSTIREYLCSEAMHGLGIPTTRALCLVGSADKVYRERVETAAVLTRMAPSHVRFGSFEVLANRDQPALLTLLADYVIDRHYPHLSGAADRYAGFFRDVVARTARLIAQWQAVGWAHGVLNTDNMSVLGLTLDYGPFGFLDDYDPGFVCNHSDYNGRYAFDQQPAIGLWNLRCFAHALLPLVSREVLLDALNGYTACFEEAYWAHMRAKCGLQSIQDGDSALIHEWLELLHLSHADYTASFRDLCAFRCEPSPANDALRDRIVDRARFQAWATRYQARLQQEHSHDDERRLRMERVNPKYVLRNYLAQVAIEKAEQQDFSEIDRLLTLLHEPFSVHPGMDSYALPPPNWGKHLSVSCSS